MPDDEPIQQVVDRVLTDVQRWANAGNPQTQQYADATRLVRELRAALAELERVKRRAFTLCSLPEDADPDVREWRRRELLYALTDDPAVLGAEPAAGGVTR